MRPTLSSFLLISAISSLLGCDPDKPIDTDLEDTGTPSAVDADGDGFAGDDDCDDSDASINPDADEACDGIDNDCDGEVDEDLTQTWYADQDGDGFGDPGGGLDSCEPGAGYVDNADDCDDTDVAIHPDADELCDGVDNDCDGAVDEDDATDATTWYADADADGYGDTAVSQQSCDEPSGFVAVTGTADSDCDDTDTTINPAAAELCDGVDNDCDGAVDEDDATDASTWYADNDGDGFGDGSVSQVGCEAPSGFVANGSDCDDTDANINESAAELCDGVDNDCDGTADERDALDASTWYADDDADGFGDVGSTTVACDEPSGYAADSSDCDDSDATISPAVAELCDGVDNDCDGTVDEDDSADASTWYADADADGYGDAGAIQVACTAPSGHIADSSDCDDSDAAVNPAATELCDGMDNDCDGIVDEDDATDAATWYADSDADGYGDAGTTTDACAEPSGYLADSTDCDDSDATINPAATELCDGADNDCDGTVDEDDASDAATWYADSDGDGYGDVGSTTAACSEPSGYLGDSDDCDDSDSAVNPAATELCDGVDNDCDGTVDEDAAADAATWYADADADGYGDPGSTTAACTEPSGYIADSSDCDDTDASSNPGAIELWYDGVDSDCDGNPEPDPCTGLPGADSIAWDSDAAAVYPDPADWSVSVEWRSSDLGYSTGSSYSHVMVLPVVGQLTDDNGDGMVDAADTPDVAYTTFAGSGYASAGYLRVLSGDGSEEHLSISAVSDGSSTWSIEGAGGVAIGDIDADGLPEIVTIANGGYVLALEHDGSFAWVSSTSTGYDYAAPALHDMDDDGYAEVVVGGLVLDHTGTTLFNSGSGGSSYSFAADIDLDGVLDLVDGNDVYDASGALIWTSSEESRHTTVADFDGDGAGELLMHYGDVLSLVDDDGTTLWSNSYSGMGVGAQVVADFDGDGSPEIGVPGAYIFTMVDSDGSTMWATGSYDPSSGTMGCSAFDFDGDGQAEVVYGDRTQLFILDGATGAQLWYESSMASGSLYEYVYVADVDGDGNAEIVIGANDYSIAGWDGIVVLGEDSDAWASARPVWNQHAFYGDHVTDDGAITQGGTPWLEHNSFRTQQSAGDTPGAAPNLEPYLLGACEDCLAGTLELSVAVDNTGSVMVPAGMNVALYADNGSSLTLVEVQTTSDACWPGDRLAPMTFALSESQIGSAGLVVVLDDDGTGAGEHTESDETDNSASWTGSSCP